MLDTSAVKCFGLPISPAPRARRRQPLQLFALACNLANFLRSLVLPDRVAQWTLEPSD